MAVPVFKAICGLWVMVQAGGDCQVAQRRVSLLLYVPHVSCTVDFPHVTHQLCVLLRLSNERSVSFDMIMIVAREPAVFGGTKGRRMFFIMT